MFPLRPAEEVMESGLPVPQLCLEVLSPLQEQEHQPRPLSILWERVRGETDSNLKECFRNRIANASHGTVRNGAHRPPHRFGA